MRLLGSCFLVLAIMAAEKTCCYLRQTPARLLSGTESCVWLGTGKLACNQSGEVCEEGTSQAHARGQSQGPLHKLPTAVCTMHSKNGIFCSTLLTLFFPSRCKIYFEPPIRSSHAALFPIKCQHAATLTKLIESRGVEAAVKEFNGARHVVRLLIPCLGMIDHEVLHRVEL